MMAAVRKGPHYPVPLPPVPAPGRTGVLAALGLALLLAACGREATRPETPQARHWPQVAPDDPASANAVTMTDTQLMMWLDGIELDRVKQRKRFVLARDQRVHREQPIPRDSARHI